MSWIRQPIRSNSACSKSRVFLSISCVSWQITQFGNPDASVICERSNYENDFDAHFIDSDARNFNLGLREERGCTEWECRHSNQRHSTGELHPDREPHKQAG